MEFALEGVAVGLEVGQLRFQLGKPFGLEVEHRGLFDEEASAGLQLGFEFGDLGGDSLKMCLGMLEFFCGSGEVLGVRGGEVVGGLEFALERVAVGLVLDQLGFQLGEALGLEADFCGLLEKETRAGFELGAGVGELGGSGGVFGEVLFELCNVERLGGDLRGLRFDETCPGIQCVAEGGVVAVEAQQLERPGWVGVRIGGYRFKKAALQQGDGGGKGV